MTSTDTLSPVDALVTRGAENFEVSETLVPESDIGSVVHVESRSARAALARSLRFELLLTLASPCGGVEIRQVVRALNSPSLDQRSSLSSGVDAGIGWGLGCRNPAFGEVLLKLSRNRL